MQRQAEPEVQAKYERSHLTSRSQPPAGLQGERAHAGCAQCGPAAVSGIGSCCTSDWKRWNR